jgi:hypothetical protein
METEVPEGGGAEAGREAFDAAGPPAGAPELGQPQPYGAPGQAAPKPTPRFG